jgi:ATP-binding cassette subfamily B protein
MSAEILNEIAGNRDRKKLILLVLITIGSNLLIAFISGLFTKASSNSDNILHNNESRMLNNKILSLDYEDLENPDVHQLRREIDEAARFNGNGRWKLTYQVNNLVSGTINLIFAIALFSELIITILRNNADITMFIFFTAIIILTLANVFYRSYSGKVVAQKMADWAKISADGARIDNGLNETYNMGKDTRLYRQDKFILRIKAEVMKISRHSHTQLRHTEFNLEIFEQILDKTLRAVTYVFICIYALKEIIGVGSVLKYVGCLQRLIDAVSSISFSINDIKNNI